MATIRNIVFSLCILLCCASVIGGWLLKAAGVYDAPTRSYLEGRVYQTFPDVSATTIAEGEFQNQMEKYLADHIPQREDVMLASASIQRSTIEAANIPFGYPLYPTYFSSKFYCWPSQKALVEVRKSMTEDEQNNVRNAARGIGALAEKARTTKWVIYMPDRLMFSAAAPQFALSNRAVSYDQVASLLQEDLPGNVTFLNGGYQQLDLLVEDYFHTDHHWAIFGAVKAYEAVAAELGFTPVPYSFAEVEPGDFYGSSTRAGRCMDFADPLIDVVYDASPLQVYRGTEDVGPSYICEAFSSEGFKRGAKYDAFYGSYYHDSTGDVLTIVNENAPEGALLILEDSFAFSTERLYAEQYRTVYCIDPRKYRNGIDIFLAEHPDVQDVLVIANPETILAGGFTAGVQPVQ